ncbi:MAG: putative toxin-antitoxin system toxin component, PIN family [Candidatus Brockarchaeota archaeon]|uniref:putative toxin-antitoxin system toxin component, PIN family n=1 Tax=Thermofilum sp. TaxID=1961369 RepID=UPI00315EF7DA|nr:putative toxin-antitoxin system toxin component, PIN family [Candidatus Brockarchaeota archaeon]MBO3802070.1 putative toxin-antitoxin system toxin component, PIN family [Candidatus Brockarchaeota archaeon]
MKKRGKQPKKLKVVLDTNILVSAWLWEGNESKIVEMIENGLVVGYTSPQLIQEFEKVMNYPKFRLSEEEIANAIGYYQIILRTIEPKIVVNIIRNDPADNRVLDCALSAKANAIITGDKHLLALEKFKNIRIVTSTEFLKLIKPD